MSISPKAGFKKLLKTPLLMQDDPLAREEARELEEFWNIRSVCEGAPPLHDLPALGVLRREESRQTQSNVHPWGSNAVKP